MSEGFERELAVFSTARQLPVEERVSYLEQCCAGDAALRQRVEELLRSVEQAGEFLQGSAPGAQRPAEASACPKSEPMTGGVGEKAGDRIGRYKLLQQIGEGGCGIVYMAEQEEPVRRRVALKVIKLGMDTKQVIARFEAERQALAMMEHANIAKVLDAGTTETGRPYFVMELVRGIKITEYCDEHSLPTKERLELFMQVCHAVQHAHQKGIIHRDLKPSNILVASDDGVPVPKIIDFGIAKATQGRLTDQTLFTAFEQFIGTPAYMSPEQAELTMQDVDTRTDIYSLGVLLYELLTGRTPFDARDLLASGLDAMRRTIREQEPERPSTWLSTLVADELTTTARHRHTEAAKLIHSLRGDLDWIVMKCLEKDRARRYETANGLASDVKRHLNCEPVVARPPSRLYEFQKTVRRHKFGFVAGAALIAVLAVGVAVSTFEAVQATRAEREQARQRQIAQTKEKKSEQVAQFLEYMLEGVGPSRALGRDTTMLREILDKAAQRLNNLEGQPAVEADMRATLGNVYADLGEYTNAAAMHRGALALRKKLLGDEHPEVANSLTDLGRVLYRQGKFAEAETLHREALAMRRKLLGAEHLDVATSLDDLARMLEAQSKLVEAEATWREALAMRRKLLGNEHIGVAYVLHPLAWTLGSGLRKLTEAEALSREELAIWRKHYGNEAPNVGWALGDLTIFLREQGKLAEAESTAHEALAIARKQSGNDPGAVGGFLRQLAWVLYREGKSAEAEGISREELALRRKVFGNEHPEVAATLQCLATFLSDQGKTAEAETTIREALVIREAKLPDNWQTFNARSLLGESLLRQKKYADAEPFLLSGYEGLKQREDKIPAVDRLRLTESLQRVLQLYEATGQLEKVTEWKQKLAQLDKTGK